eukprot:scaffold41600_cov82-Phaeocystis_antarctica.AAC.4
MLGVSLSTMRGGAVGPFSSCLRHAARCAGKKEDGRKIRKRGAVRCGGGGGGCARDERRLMWVMVRLLFGSVVDCLDAWQLLRSAAKSAVNRLSE